MLDLLLLAALAGAQTAADPLAAARTGQIQCISPNKEKKTCVGMARYQARFDGSFETTTTVMVAPQPMITMTVHSPVKAEGGAVCGPMRKADYEAATFEIDGKPADAATADAIRAQVLAAFAPLDGKKGCSRERPEGELHAVDVTLDGVARPDLGQKGLWVKPGDGYKLGM